MTDRALVDRVRRRVVAYVAGRDLLRRTERPLLLLSGGPDSMALLDIVLAVSDRLGLGTPPRALHVDYRTRGADSDRDRRIVERACEAAGVPLEVERLAGRLTGPRFEERARELRYEAARRLVAAGDADVIVTGHNRDDQAETVLYRLAKYASPSSLVGMRPREGDLARPLLRVGAAELRDYCDAADIEYGVDVTNADTGYARNLVRHEVLPRLARVNPAVVETIADAADLAAAERAVVTAATDEAWRRIVLAPLPGEEAALDVGALAAQAEALRPLCLRRLLQIVYGPEALIDRRTTAALARLAADTRGSARVSLRGGREALREYDRLAVRRRAGRHACPPAAVEPGAVVEFCGRRYTAATLDGPHPGTGGREAHLGVTRPGLEVTLRHPRRGDRFQPLGMAGPQLVSRFLSAAKVPREARERAVVAEIDGKIAWVSPGRISESYRVAARTPYTLHVSEEDL